MNNKTLLGLLSAAVAAAAVAVALILVQPWHSQPPHAPSGDIAAALPNQLTGANGDVAQVYQRNGQAPLWYGARGLTDDARQAMALLAASDQEGLPAARYRLTPPAANAAASVNAAFDVQLTTALLRYARDMRWGAFRPTQFFNDVSMPVERDDVAAGLAQAAASGGAASYLRGLAPPVREYGVLREALARYRALAMKGGWHSVAAETKLSPQNLAALKARLQMEGYLPADAAPQVPDSKAVLAALKVYQADSGMDPDGKLDQRTADMLNVPALARAQQIAINMERLRWMPHQLGERYVLVNVPDATLALMESGRPAIVSRVVVGEPDKPTPILATRAVAVTINPAWHVPRSIVKNEIQPKLDQDPGYLEKKNMVMEDGEVTQLPGPGNALGTAKFEMPNNFDVYLHDTPSKQAFLSDERAQSHGCVRVQQIHALVEHVLELRPEELQDLIAQGETTQRKLKEPFPVYIQYITAIAREDRTAFREDVYGRDARMIGSLFPQTAPAQLASSR